MFTINITRIKRVAQHRDQPGSLYTTPDPVTMASFTLRRSSNITFREWSQLRQPAR